MNGPIAGLGGAPEATARCPTCGRSLAGSAPAAVIDARVEVGQNLGSVRAVEAGVVQGDLLTNVYQAQVYVLSEAGRTASWRRFIGESTPPYRLLAAYTAQDHALFKGRDAETADIVRRIGEQSGLVVYGEPGVGKSSVISAGVVPALIERGTLVVTVRDYRDPVATIRAALAAGSEQLPIPLPEGNSLAALVGAVRAATGGGLVIIFDQVEALFDPGIGADGRGSLIAQLAESRWAVDPAYLRWIFVAREDVLGRLPELQAALPDLLRGAVRIGLLDRAQARQAIEEPLRETGFPVSFVGDLVVEQILPDLDDLTPDVPGIQPAHLQIVCHRLYELARGRQPAHIDARLYRQAKGAEGIIAACLEDMLRTDFAERRWVVEALLADLAEPRGRVWIDLADLSAGAAPDTVRAVAEGLVAVGLLLKRGRPDHPEYSLATPALADELRRLIGSGLGRPFQAEDELERAWAGWLLRECLPTRGQLRYLAAARDRLRPQPVRALFLLRAAVARQTPADPWLAALATPDGRSLIGQLEMPASAELGGQLSRSVADKATALLGLDADGAVEPDRAADPPGRGYGPVARAAIGDPDPITRETAALALSVPDPYLALDRLTWALRSEISGFRRRLRRAEIWSALIEARPDIGALAVDVGPLDRALIWCELVGRRLRRDQRRIVALTAGGAVGSGLAVGLLRGVIGLPTTMGFSQSLGIYLYFATILGGALTVGLALVRPLLLSPDPSGSEVPGGVVNGAPVSRRTTLLTMAAAALFFGLAHALMALLTGSDLSTARLIPLLGFVAGAGLGGALAGRPADGQPIGIASWLARLVAVGLFFAALQGVFIVANRGRAAHETLGTGLSLVWNGDIYADHYGFLIASLWGPAAGSPTLYNALALLDAALVGATLTLGVGLGLIAATRQLNRLRALSSRLGD